MAAGMGGNKKGGEMCKGWERSKGGRAGREKGKEGEASAQPQKFQKSVLMIEMHLIYSCAEKY